MCTLYYKKVKQLTTHTHDYPQSEKSWQVKYYKQIKEKSFSLIGLLESI